MAKKSSPPQKKLAGRPKEYIQAEWEPLIIEALQEGIGIAKWCKEESGRPSRSVVITWSDADSNFKTSCARAREWAADIAAEKHNQAIEDCYSGKILPDVARAVMNGLQWQAMTSSHRYSAKTREEKQFLGADGKAIDPPSNAATVEQLIEEATKRGLPTDIFKK